MAYALFSYFVSGYDNAAGRHQPSDGLFEFFNAGYIPAETQTVERSVPAMAPDDFFCLSYCIRDVCGTIMYLVYDIHSKPVGLIHDMLHHLISVKINEFLRDNHAFHPDVVHGTNHSFPVFGFKVRKIHVACPCPVENLV